MGASDGVDSPRAGPRRRPPILSAPLPTAPRKDGHAASPPPGNPLAGRRVSKYSEGTGVALRAGGTEWGRPLAERQTQIDLQIAAPRRAIIKFFQSPLALP
jgi:hypothetical protein